MDNLYLHDDPLTKLARAGTFHERLAIVHDALRRHCPGIDRMAVAMHDPLSGQVKTFAASPADESPLGNYEIPLADASSLLDTAARRNPRVVNDLGVFAAGRGEHIRRILGHGYASSYTLPIIEHTVLIGFVFCNSMHKGYFRNGVLQQVNVHAHLVARLLLGELAGVRTLNAALRTTISMVHERDPETGGHLERMARYSRLIARELVARGKCSLDDEQVEQLFNFAPLHDVGKLGIPDRILLKPGVLAPDERAEMTAHPLIGLRLVDALIGNFGLEGVPYIETLRQLVEYHHETLDGAGYPHGLQGAAIPLAARIVAVSDVFDALTSARPYKEPWPCQHACAMLQLMAIDKLDPDCVAALLDRQEEALAIRERFADLPVAA